MAFMRSGRSTVWATKTCRAGMSKAFTTPSNSEVVTRCQMWTWPLRVSSARTSASTMDADWVMTTRVWAAHAVCGHAAHGGQEEHRELSREGHEPQHGRLVGQPVDQPGLGHTLHPGADEGDQLP